MERGRGLDLRGLEDDIRKVYGRVREFRKKLEMSEMTLAALCRTLRAEDEHAWRVLRAELEGNRE